MATFNPENWQISNAKQIYNFFKGNGWTEEAIAAVLGNFQQESSLNPNEWQSGMQPWGSETGYGLAQWTPIQTLITYCDGYGITDYDTLSGQCQCIQDEVENGDGQYIAKPGYEMSFEEFTQSTNSVNYLTEAFMINYERPGAPDLSNRQTYANGWYEFFNGENISSNTGNSGNTSNTGSGTYITYTVKAGDSLSVIAEKFGVTVAELQEWNGISNPNKIYVGEVLKIYTNNSGTGNSSPNSGSGSSGSNNLSPISTGIDYNSNGGINIGNQPTYNWNAKVTASQIEILNLDGTSPGSYYTSAGDHITILDIDGDQQMALIQYPDQSAGIYQQGWISSSYISQDYMDQTFYSLWTNNVENQQIIFHDGTIAATSLTQGTETTFLYVVNYNDTTYACIAYIDDNGNPESGYVPWSSGSLNMIGPDIPYYAKYGTEAVKLTYDSNAVTQASEIAITDINGISIPNSYTSNGDEILILNVYMEAELVMIEYPDQAAGVYYTGFIPAESLINGDVSINSNTVTWNNSDGSYDMYGISTNDLLYTLPASQTVQYLYETSGGYACILFNNNNTTDELLETGYTSSSNGTFSFN
ncbi:phage tail tip lysozyme [Clostridium mediterraneense]|uniref:phage tail tip lysozyme n=1 Tax=Clostridium mediterraneense TaxID=1805472 RepID=UPI00082BD6E1|nr:phage tail tip lysozyme [Clostridium mediterraneense]